MDVRLAVAVMHDLKNALFVLENKLRDMRSAPTSDQAAQAHDTCTALQDKLVGFLTIYKADTLGLEAHIDAVNPEDFINGLLKTRITIRPDLPISVKTEDMPTLAFFDEYLVGLALEAVLQNASRFARSQVWISCEKEEQGNIMFSIHDDGPGLGTKEDKPSTGLGMALCESIAESHTKGDKKGSVLLRNHPDGGAVFEIRLP